MRQDIEKLIEEEVKELLSKDEVWLNIYDTIYIGNIITERLKNKGYTANQIKEIKISIYGKLRYEILQKRGTAS